MARTHTLFSCACLGHCTSSRSNRLFYTLPRLPSASFWIRMELRGRRLGSRLSDIGGFVCVCVGSFVSHRIRARTHPLVRSLDAIRYRTCAVRVYKYSLAAECIKIRNPDPAPPPTTTTATTKAQHPSCRLLLLVSGLFLLLSQVGDFFNKLIVTNAHTKRYENYPSPSNRLWCLH